MASVAVAVAAAFAVSTGLCSRQRLERDDNLFDRDLIAEPIRTSKDLALDLEMDLSGVWRVRAGTTVGFQYIWQECMEVTITGDDAPLHHHIHNGEYITLDDTETSTTDEEGIFSYKAIIAKPTKKEAEYGAKASLVFYVEPDMPSITQTDGTVTTHPLQEVAIRFIDSRGQMRMQQNVSGGMPLLAFRKMADMPCSHPYSSASEYCAAKSYTDKYNSFTPACCGEGYAGSTDEYFNGNPGLANQAWEPYVASCLGEAPESSELHATGMDTNFMKTE